MNDKIDVLAVMDRAAESAGEIVKASNGDFRAVIYQDDLFKARAAIAELIAAGKRMDKMHALLMAKTNHAASFYDAECFREMNEAPLQMQAALARVGGGK